MISAFNSFCCICSHFSLYVVKIKQFFHLLDSRIRTLEILQIFFFVPTNPLFSSSGITEMNVSFFFHKTLLFQFYRWYLRMSISSASFGYKIPDSLHILKSFYRSSFVPLLDTILGLFLCQPNLLYIRNLVIIS